MAEPIAALIVRILADTSEMVTGIKNVSGQLDTFENRVMKFGKALGGYFTVQAVASFASQLIAEADAIDTASKRVGAGVVEYQKFAFALKQTAGDSADASQAIAMLNERVGSSDVGLLSALRKVNISFDEFRAKDPIQRYIDLGVAINSIQDPAQRTATAVEALGMKGEKSLAGIDLAFKDLADQAPAYSEQTIEALDRAGDIFDQLWMSIKVGAAEAVVAIATVGQAADELAKRRQRAGAVAKSEGFLSPYDAFPELPDPMNPTPPSAPKPNLPALLGPGGVNPEDAKALSVALADLALKYEQVKQKNDAAKDAFDATNWILRTLKIEVPQLATEMQKLMDKMGTTTKVEQMTQRIIDQAMRIRDLRVEQERLLEVINPGSTRIAGDDVDAAIFELRSDPRNFDRQGNLTPQAFEIESQLLNNFSLRQVANQLTPKSTPAIPLFGAQFPGSPTGVAPVNITVNAQGGFWDSPDRINQLARTVEDSIAKRSGLANTYSRR